MSTLHCSSRSNPLPPTFSGYPTGDRAGWAEFAAEYHRALGPVQILVNNAGIGSANDAAAWQLDPESWHATHAINLHAPFELARLVLPDMIGAGATRAAAPLRVALRRNWFYRRLLKGQLADSIAFHPYDALPRRLEEADALLRGRFRFHGESPFWRCRPDG